MRKFISVIGMMAVLAVSLSSMAVADHRNPNLGFDPSNSVSVGATVKVTGYDTSTEGDVHIDQCRLDGAPRAAVVCDPDEGGTGAWVQVASKNKTSATSPVEYAAPTGTAGVFGYRARSAHDSDVGDLTVTANNEAQRHSACNGIEVAHGKVKDDGNAKDKLAKHAEKFRCDIE